MKIIKALEVVSNNLLILIEKLEKIEKYKDKLSKEDRAIVAHIEEQAMMRTTLILVFNDNLKEYNQDFIKEEIKKSQFFCKTTLSKLREIELFLSKD